MTTDYRVNRQIRIPEVRLIDEKGAQIGVVTTAEAMRLAEAAKLDLVEVSPMAKPPVCRILDFGKFKYAQRKKERGHHSRASQLKELRVRPGTDAHDLERQLKKAQEFLEDGQRVKFTLRFRGREMAHQDLGRAKLEGVADQLADIGWVEISPRTEGRVMHLVMAPGQRKKHAPAGAAPTGAAAGQGGAKLASATAPASAPAAS